ncbi:hypothetical protein JF50_06650 [Pseudoalteromonas luteoviolacea]|uniref:Lipoprotein n=1 Tax=Pseudoalteromonas luteoviolacea TaxID=43657 RepID=A0A0C1QG78_9GAMM|nr:hypothetical protein [Pseudoalteromonas luteoviolacea]KID58345.1 hypothetical protein JF50_06650 [Pseudoalteromonas luteoviolacea]
MKAILSIITLSLLPLLTACQSNQLSKTEDNGYRCEQVRSLGTSIPNKRCTTKEQRREERKHAQDQVRESQRNVLTSAIGSGG